VATWSQTSKTQQNEPRAKPTNTTTTSKPNNIHMHKMKHKRTSLNNKMTLKYQNRQDNNKKKQGKKHTTTNTTPNIIKKRELHTKKTCKPQGNPTKKQTNTTKQQTKTSNHYYINQKPETRRPRPQKQQEKAQNTKKLSLNFYWSRRISPRGNLITFARFCCSMTQAARPCAPVHYRLQNND
jgi:hypothetical protein